MSSQWTPDAIRALGATTDLPTLGSIFGLGRWRSYQMAHTGEWEQAGIHVIQIGARYRVAVQSILDVLTQGGKSGSPGMHVQTEPCPGQPPGTGDGGVPEASGPMSRSTQ
jgi:hypothetical protein